VITEWIYSVVSVWGNQHGHRVVGNHCYVLVRIFRCGYALGHSFSDMYRYICLAVFIFGLDPAFWRCVWKRNQQKLCSDIGFD
jgi:hypothetical protein